jgi:protein arginine kinase
VIDTNLRFSDHEDDWIYAVGPVGDVVVSSRVRLARNIAGFPFVSRASEMQRRDLLRLVAANAETWAGGMIWIDLNEISPLDRNILVERHLISANHAKGSQPRAVAVAPDESTAVMVNEEDHLRLQCIRPGLQLADAYAAADRLDDEIESTVDFCFSDRFGYLTACPTNVGTGIRVSVMLHLPALRLRGEIDNVKRAAKDMTLALRGYHGEGSEASGDFYQLSNQTTLGRTEEDILSEFVDKIIPAVVEYEHQAREALLRKRRAYLEDQVWRAYGLLSNARLLETDETLKLLSMVRLGCCMNLLPNVSTYDVNSLLLQTQPAHLQRVVGGKLDQATRRRSRADLVRNRLTGR